MPLYAQRLREFAASFLHHFPDKECAHLLTSVNSSWSDSGLCGVNDKVARLLSSTKLVARAECDLMMSR